MNVQQLCEKCSDIVSLSLHTSVNSDQIVCIEACAKMCHALLFCTVCGMLDQIVLTKLHEVCEWCKNICERLQINSRTECCQVSWDRARRYVICVSHTATVFVPRPQQFITYLGECCKEMLQKGMINKPPV